MSRLISLTMNVNCTGRRTTVRELMLFPAPVTEAEMQARIDHAKASLMGAMDSVRKA